jgi:hypothetical protein
MPFFSTLGGVIGVVLTRSKLCTLIWDRTATGKELTWQGWTGGVMGYLLNNLHCTAASACQSEHNGKTSAGNIFNALLVVVRIHDAGGYTCRKLDAREGTMGRERRAIG